MERREFKLLGSKRQQAEIDYSDGHLDYEQLKREIAWKLPREVNNQEA